MSRLEESVEPILIPLMRGDPGRLSWGQCKTLATWVFKTTTMVDCLASDASRGIPPKHLEVLYRDRRPPAACQIWVVPTVGGPRIYGGKYSTATGKIEKFAEVIPQNTYAATFMLGRIGFFVFGTGRPEALEAEAIAPVLGPGVGLTPIWPRRPGERLNWPPPFGAERDIDWLKITLENLRAYIRARRGQS